MLKTLPKCFKSNWKSHIKNWHMRITILKTNLQIIFSISYYLVEKDIYLSTIFLITIVVLQETFLILDLCNIGEKLCKKFVLKLKVGMNHLKRKVKLLWQKQCLLNLKCWWWNLVEECIRKAGGQEIWNSFFEDEIYEVSFLSSRFSNLLNQTRKEGN